ncbi:MAG: hypothetical protein K9I34_06045 [Bacteroidales bacterium]|nr:hypothetical protein [Bacteroidales bacterium]
MRIILLWLAGFLLFACQPGQPESVLYQSPEFSISRDGIIQGKYQAKALSANEIQSDYVSTAHLIYPRKLVFKFSMNEKDNELPGGVNHEIFISDESFSDTILFGQPYEKSESTQARSAYLPANYNFKVYVDMAPVLEAFAKQGYYEGADGSRLAAADFKSISIAGASLPLSWDWVNLEEKGLTLTQIESSSIYSIDLILNPFDESAPALRTWKKSVFDDNQPVYRSDQVLLDALYAMSLEEAKLAIEADSTFRTGAKWGGVWTRDVSYSTLLNFALLEPEVAKISLMKKVNRDRIIQDTGSGGAWPVSSDRTTWALAAWEIYKATGDTAWLKSAFQIIKSSLEDDYLNLPDPTTGLFKGESSFIDWREQSYPRWMDNSDIAQSLNLGTNAVHYEAHIILAQMADLLGEPSTIYIERAHQLKTAMNEHLWQPEKGYYAQYLYGRDWMLKSPRFETLGESFCVLFDIADENQQNIILDSAPLTTYGATVFYPQIPDIPPYHNNAIWPFVQSFWNLAAAKVGNEAVLSHGMASVIRAAGLFLTNYENMVADNGDYQGTEINSHRMLWSMAGYMSMIHRVLIGIILEKDGIRFKPVIPQAYQGERELAGLHYRNARLTIRVNGYGNEISSFKINGKEQPDAYLSADLSGDVLVEIEMKSQPFPAKSLKIHPNVVSLPTPKAYYKEDPIKVTLGFPSGILYWHRIAGAKAYQVYSNGLLLTSVQDTFFRVKLDFPAELAVIALDDAGIQSFAAEPIRINQADGSMKLEMEIGAKDADIQAINYSGKGYVKTSVSYNSTITRQMKVDNPGMYILTVRYSNGTGPWNTDNNCCIRTLYVNGVRQGSMLFPQRGTNEWSDWGFSNRMKVLLTPGVNTISLVYEPWNTNMDIAINECLLDYLDFRMIE